MEAVTLRFHGYDEDGEDEFSTMTHWVDLRRFSVESGIEPDFLYRAILKVAREIKEADEAWFESVRSQKFSDGELDAIRRNCELCLNPEPVEKVTMYDAVCRRLGLV